MLINDELKLFIRDITLFLQKHSHYDPEKIEPMFQRAYRLYVKYEVENEQVDSADGINPAPKTVTYQESRQRKRVMGGPRMSRR